VERKVEFASGEILIGATQAGKLVDAGVAVRAPGNRQQIAGGRTYTDPKNNPKRIVLPPGRYVITVSPVRPARAWRPRRLNSKSPRARRLSESWKAGYPLDSGSHKM
jgi:hypothetical protein